MMDGWLEGLQVSNFLPPAGEIWGLEIPRAEREKVEVCVLGGAGRQAEGLASQLVKKGLVHVLRAGRFRARAAREWLPPWPVGLRTPGMLDPGRGGEQTPSG